ncbi:MAG: dipeptidase [bacterium]
MKRLLLYLASLLLVLLAFFFLLAPVLVDRLANRLSGEWQIAPSEEAINLHDSLFVADLHCDVLLWNRNILKRNGRGHIDIPRLLEGHVALQFFTVVSKVPFGLNMERNPATSDMITLLAAAQRWPVASWGSLEQRALYQARKLHDFAAKSRGKLRLIKSVADLEAYLRQRQETPWITAGLLGIEGAQVLEGDLSKLDDLFSAGFRMMAPTHFFDTEVGGSAHGVNKGGLTPLGREMVTRMQQKGMLVDLAHASPKVIDDVLALATKPVVVSHTGVKGTCDNVRNISDAHISGIANTGGVVGIAFFEKAVCGTDVQAIVRAIKHVVALAGVDYVALGSDFDGAVATPFDATGMVEITDALLNEGFSHEAIAKIMGGNVVRVLRACLPKNSGLTTK